MAPTGIDDIIARGFDLTDEVCWAAVESRDWRLDGQIFYGVRSTKIYCRPSCPAKRPKRDRVRFFQSSKAAKEAGFRACKRCLPDRFGPDAKLAAGIVKACRLIEAADTAPQLFDLATAAGVSPSHFHRQFKSLTGITPKAYASAVREARARTALQHSATITEAIYEAGYGASSRFYAAAPNALGMSPKAFRGGGVGEVITHALCPCTLGLMLVATSEKGVCAIYLGDDADALRAALKAQFPRARHETAPPEFTETIAAVASLIEAPGSPCALPLDIRGTAFQRRVFEALRCIPAGSTTSYAQLASAIGAPKAARAVANACAANQIAVAIPCHRVVRGDGSISGYRWGAERKQALLDAEMVKKLRKGS